MTATLDVTCACCGSAATATFDGEQFQRADCPKCGVILALPADVADALVRRLPPIPMTSPAIADGAFPNAGDSEARFVADGGELNCPACGGSGHVGDVQYQDTHVAEARKPDCLTDCVGLNQ